MAIFDYNDKVSEKVMAFAVVASVTLFVVGLWKDGQDYRKKLKQEKQGEQSR